MEGKRTCIGIEEREYVQRDIATESKWQPRRTNHNENEPAAPKSHRLAQSASTSPASFDGPKVLDSHQSNEGGQVLVEMLLIAIARGE